MHTGVQHFFRCEIHNLRPTQGRMICFLLVIIINIISQGKIHHVRSTLGQRQEGRSLQVGVYRLHHRETHHT